MRVLGGGTVSEPSRRKLEALDGIRGIAVLMVMVSHYARFLPQTAAGTALQSIFAFGGFGVDLFFVLSGFLITGILVQTRTAPNYFRSFYARRTLRIFPIYYATLAVVFGAAAFLPAALDRVPPPADRIWYVTYLCNWIGVVRGAWPPNVVGHFWSLAVEEQFYLVWPAVVLLATRRTVLAAIAGGACLVAPILRVIDVAQHGPNVGVTLSTFMHMDPLFAGALCALAFLRSERFPRGLLAAGLAALVIFAACGALLPWRQSFLDTIGYSLLSLGFGAVILFAADGDRSGDRARGDLLQRMLRWAPLRRVGIYSYGMYVYHVPLLGICELMIWNHVPAALHASFAAAALYIVLLVIATFAVAAVSYELVEKRFLALKRFAEPRPARSPAPLAPAVRSPRGSAPPASPKS